MNCAEYQEWISIEMDGELVAERAALLHEHLRDCSRCRQAVEDYKVNRILIQAMEPRRAPADGLARLQARIAQRTDSAPPVSAEKVTPLAARRSSPTRAGMPRWLQGLQAVACLAVIFVATLAWLGYTDADTPSASDVATIQLERHVAVQPRDLMRGHAYTQASNPVADGSAWHYLASEDENAMPSGDDDDDTQNQSSDAGRKL